MKKITALALYVLLFIGCVSSVNAVFADVYTIGTYSVNESSVNIYTSADITSAKLGEAYKGNVVTVTALSSGFGFIYRAATGISGWVQLSSLKYINSNSGTPDGITGIELTKPHKTVYTQGEETFDDDGLEVYAVYENGARLPVKGYSVFCDTFDSYGKKTVTVYYLSFSASFEVEVAKVPVKNITILSLPSKTSYIENEKLNLEGLSVKVSYSDGRADEVYTLEQLLADGKFVISDSLGAVNGGALVNGTHVFSVTYMYEEISTSFEIAVRERTLLSIELTKQPDTYTVYTNLTKPTLAGAEITATYDNGEKETVLISRCTIECDEAAFVIGDGNKVYITYGGKSIMVAVRFSPLEISGIMLKLPSALTFILGEEVDLSALRVYLVYNSGAITELEDYTMSEIDATVTGSQNVVVRWGDYSEVFTITISAYYQRGDVDGDGKITSADARQALRAAVKLTTLINKSFAAADADRDGKITSSDARLILRAAVGLENFLKK